MKASHSRRGGILSTLFLAGFLVLLSLVMGGLYIAKSFHVRKTEDTHGTDVAIDTPGGRLSIRARDNMSTAVTGIPNYPGAERIDGSGGATIEWNSNDGRRNNDLYVVGSEFRTADSAEKVVDFYRRQLPGLLIVSRHGEMPRLEYKHGGISRIIAISEKDGDTRIKIAAIEESASN